MIPWCGSCSSNPAPAPFVSGPAWEIADILLTSSEGQGRTTKTSRHKTPIFFGTTSDARSHEKTKSDTVQRTQKPVGRPRVDS